MVFKNFNTTNVVGVLRGGGDVKTGMIIDVAAMYVYAVPAAALSALVFKADITLVYTLIMAEEFIKCLFGSKRFVSRQWIRNLTRDMGQAQG